MANDAFLITGANAGIGKDVARQLALRDGTSVIDGSFFDGRKRDPMLAYGQAKYLGALWMSALARQHPKLRMLTVSPGNTTGTDATRDLPAVPRVFMQRVMPRVSPMFGISHPLEVGAKRLVDGMIGGGLRAGRFYASAHTTLTGPLFDQAAIVADFADETIQDHAYAAIHAFLPDEKESHS